MRLTKKSRDVLDLLLALGVEAFETSVNFRGSLVGIGGWSSEAAVRRHLKALGDKGWLDFDDTKGGSGWVTRVTDLGRKVAMGEFDLEAAWAEDWDGLWRMMTFDLPAWARDQRHELREWFRVRRFGHLQGSVWVTHRGSEFWMPAMEKLRIEPSAAVFLEGRPMGQLTDLEFVLKAWDFVLINGRYEAYLRFLASGFAGGGPVDTAFARWFEEETRLWRAAFELDPGLPRILRPSGYRGEEALAARRVAYERWLADMG